MLVKVCCALGDGLSEAEELNVWGLVSGYENFG